MYDEQQRGGLLFCFFHACLRAVVAEKGAGAVLGHTLLRTSFPRLASTDRAMAPSLESALDRLLRDTKGSAARAAPLWTLASLARATHSEDLRVRVWAALASEADAFYQYVALSACRVLPAALPTVDPLRTGVACADPVGARVALHMLLRQRDSAGVVGLVDELLSVPSGAVNLRDPLARVYWVQLCGHATNRNAALVAVETLVDEDVSFRVVLEGIALLSAQCTWMQLQRSARQPSVLSMLVSKVVAAFQAARPVLHLSALRASAMLARCWATTGGVHEPGAPHRLQQLVALCVMQLQNDCAYHRWQALVAMVWLMPPHEAAGLAAQLAAELRLADMAKPLLVRLMRQVLARCQAVRDAQLADAMLDCLVVWRTHAPKLLDADLVLEMWQSALGVAEAGKLLESVVGFVTHDFSPSRAALVAHVIRNAVLLLSAHLAVFLSARPRAPDTLVLFFHRCAAFGAPDTALLAREALASPAWPAEQRAHAQVALGQ